MFQPFFTSIMRIFFFVFVFCIFLYLSPFFSSYLREYLNSMHHRPKQYLLVVIFFAVKNLKTISVQGDMHIFPLTLWCSTIGMNLSLHLVLFVTDNTGFPFFREKGKMLCFKHRRFSPCPPRSKFGGGHHILESRRFPAQFHLENHTENIQLVFQFLHT